jgi:urease accessory protein
MNQLARLARPPLDLLFERRAGRTVLAQRHVTYPFFVTAPLRGRGPDAEIVLQSISGGLFGDEHVAQRISVSEGATAVIRLPSATVVHDRRDKAAPVATVSLRIDGRLSYLPRPVILLPGSALDQSVDLTVGPSATVLLQDGFLMHNPQGIAAAPRALDSRITVRDTDGRLIALDRMIVSDRDIATGPYRAFGTLWLLHALTGGFYDRLRAALSSVSGHGAYYWGMTRLRDDSGVMIRIAARDGGDLDTGMTAIRNALLGAMAP